MSTKNLDLKTQKLFIKAEKLRSQKKFIDAITVFQKILKKYPDFVPVLNNMGMSFEGIKNNDEAEKYYLRCLNISPDELISINNLSRLYFLKRDHKKAIPLFQKSLTIETDQKLVAEMLAESLFNLGLIKEANFFCEQAIKRYPESYLIKFFYGKNLLKIGQHQKGLKLMDSLVGAIEFNDKEFIIR